MAVSDAANRALKNRKLTFAFRFKRWAFGEFVSVSQITFLNVIFASGARHLVHIINKYQVLVQFGKSCVFASIARFTVMNLHGCI
jgi:hypothetical protein